MTMATADRIDTPHPAARAASEILDRLPPQNLEAERGVLGSLLLDPQMCDEVALELRADDFYADANQKLYRQILALHDEGKRIDTTLLVERLRQAGELEAVGGTAYLAEVLQAVPYAANVMHYAEIVRQKAILRALIHASTEILRDAWEPAWRSATRSTRRKRKFRRPRQPHQRPGIQHPQRAGRGLRADRRPAGARRRGGASPPASATSTP